MKIAIGCDHIVTKIKNEIVGFLEKRGIEVIDCGTYDEVRTHYPIYGKRVAEMVVNKQADCGIVLCGTGVGISNAANKIKGARCVLAEDIATVQFAREKLNANILAFGGRVIGMGMIEELILAFLETAYIPDAKKEAVIRKIDALIEEDPVLNDPKAFDDLIEKWNKGEYHD